MKKFSTLTLIMLLIFSCSGQKKSDKLTIYTSIYPIYDFTKKITGNKITNVYNIISNGEEPHHFELTPQDMVKISKADLFIYNGGGIETWIDKAKDGVQETIFVDASSNIENELDPHFWLSPEKAKIQMENIKNAIIEIDPDNAEYYEANYNLYVSKLEALDSKIRNSLEHITNRYLVVTHPAFGHFCKDFNFEQIPIAKDEADLKGMVDVINIIKENDIKAIFYEESSSKKIADSISTETGVSVLSLNPMEVVILTNDNNVDYFSIMEDNLTSIVNGLSEDKNE